MRELRGQSLECNYDEVEWGKFTTLGVYFLTQNNL